MPRPHDTDDDFIAACDAEFDLFCQQNVSDSEFMSLDLDKMRLVWQCGAWLDKHLAETGCNKPLRKYLCNMLGASMVIMDEELIPDPWGFTQETLAKYKDDPEGAQNLMDTSSIGRMTPTHRDDLEPEMIAKLEAEFPGMKLVCMGDLPDDQVPETVRELFEQVKMSHMESLVNGTCLDCGEKMPDFPDDATMPDDWQPAEGWRWFTKTGTDEITAFQCPACDALEESEALDAM